MGYDIVDEDLRSYPYWLLNNGSSRSASVLCGSNSQPSKFLAQQL